jgi:hypothetical protein
MNQCVSCIDVGSMPLILHLRYKLSESRPTLVWQNQAKALDAL